MFSLSALHALGDHLNKPLAALAALIVAMSAAGCSTASTESESPSASATTTAPSAQAGVSTETTCSQVFDGGQGSLFFTTVNAVAAIEKGDLTQTVTARDAADKLSGITGQSGQQLKNYVSDMQLVALKASMATASSHQPDTTRLTAAGLSLIKACPGAVAAGNVQDALASASTAAKAAPASGITYTLSCSAGSGGSTTIADYKAAWSQPYDLCTVGTESGTPSTSEKAASTTAYGDPTKVKYLYALCATTAGHYVSGTVSDVQAKEIAGALTLCPDHPKKAQLEANASAGTALAADSKNGKLVYTGKYLVGKDVVPGTWQSQGDNVQDCYWEVSDAQGNIIANNFINIAPKVTIQIPADAAGFTVQGCGFRWVGP